MCLSAAFLFQLAIIIVIIVAAIALIRLVLPTLAMPPQFQQAINILIWAVVAICIIVFIWRLAECSGLMRLG